MQLKSPLLVYNPREEEAGTVRVPGWGEDINTRLHSLWCRPEFSLLFLVTLQDGGALQTQI